MKRVVATFLIAVIFLLLQAKSTTYADLDLSKLNHSNDIDDKKIIFTQDNQGKNKEQVRIKGNNFMIKGVITASSSDSITINGLKINLDSSVTGSTKIAGNIKPGAYAMTQGLIQNSNYYAAKIVVDNRNKIEDENELKENEENETPTISPAPTISPTLTPAPLEASSTASLEKSEKGGAEINFDMKTLFNSIHNMFLSIREFMLSA